MQAALAEIAAAARSGGDHDVPSILMQAARMADADTGLVPSPDTWDAVSAASPAVTPPPPTPVARPVLPARFPPAPSTPAAIGEAGQETDLTEGPPSQEVPATGGLRRLMGTRKT